MDFIQKVKQLIDIKDVVGDVVELAEVGDVYQGLCPFHPDSAPSFTVYDDHYHCFGCGAHGNVIDFVMKQNGLGFRQAVAFLSGRVDIEIPNDFGGCKSTKDYWYRRKMLVMTCEFYHQNLTDEVTGYLVEDRGLTEETIERFQLGYASGGLADHLSAKGSYLNAAREIGLVKGDDEGRPKDHFWNHIIIPCLVGGEPVSFVGRSFGGGRSKYLYLPGNREHLFNEGALRHDEVVIVEGVFDALSLEQAGYHAAALGGLSLKDEWLPKLERASKVYVCLDGDTAGNEAAYKLCRKLGVRAYPIKLPDGKDVNELFVEGREDEFHNLYDAAQPYFDELLSRAKGLGESEKASLYHDEVVPMLSSLSGGEFEIYANSTTKAFKIGKKAIREDVAKYEARNKTVTAQPTAKRELTKEERDEAFEILKNPNMLDFMLADTEKIGCVGEEHLKKLLYIAMTSRLLRKPINIIVLGESSSGKSFTVETVSRFFPDEDVTIVTRMTAQALFHLNAADLKHKVLVIVERHGSEESDYSVRALMSEGKLKLWMPEKDSYGNLATVEKVVEGPISYIETTTDPFLHPENETRVFVVGTDDSTEQTRRIFEAQKRQYLPDAALPQTVEKFIERKWQNVQTLLKPMKVIIPFVRVIEFPDGAMRARRDHGRFLAMIEASALLHQHQRETQTVEDEEFVVATIDDYRLAYELGDKIIDQALVKGISDRGIELVEAAAKLWSGLTGDEKFITRSALRQKLGWNKNLIEAACSEAVKVGCLEVTKGGPGVEYHYKFVTKASNEESPLLSPEMLLALIEEAEGAPAQPAIDDGEEPIAS